MNLGEGHNSTPNTSQHNHIRVRTHTQAYTLCVLSAVILRSMCSHHGHIYPFLTLSGSLCCGTTRSKCHRERRTWINPEYATQLLVFFSAAVHQCVTVSTSSKHQSPGKPTEPGSHGAGDKEREVPVSGLLNSCPYSAVN